MEDHTRRGTREEGAKVSPLSGYCKPRGRLILLLANFLAIAFACKGFLDAALFAWLQVEGVALDLFDDVLGLHFALEAAQRIFKRFTLLNSNLCQKKYTSKPACMAVSKHIAASPILDTFSSEKAVTRTGYVDSRHVNLRM